MNDSVDTYFLNGCMRCPKGGTLDCKIHTWVNELALLREVIKQTSLIEECKWGVPCYTYGENNVLTLSALKDHCAIGFFKGVLLNDKTRLLQKPGPRSQAARKVIFRSVDEILLVKNDLLDLVHEAIKVEVNGERVIFSKEIEDYPVELVDIFQEDPLIKSAFESLTPGRQRGYLIHFSQAKQSATRIKRILKCVPKILNGEGMHDKYKSSKN